MEYSAKDLIECYVAEPNNLLFEPDVVLPSQFFVPDQEGIEGGERKLMAAILSDGIEAYITYAKLPACQCEENQLKAAEWVETEDYSYVFSFDNVCHALGINPAYLRMGLNRYLKSVSTENKQKQQKQEVVWKRIRRPRKH